MSKFEELNSVISHWKGGVKVVSIPTNLYIFGEAQSTGSSTYYDYTTWEWQGKTITIQEVGIHPDISG